MTTLQGSRTWLALLAVPVLALLYQTLAYAAIPPACSMQTMLFVHALSIAAMLGCLVPTLLAAREWRRLHHDVATVPTPDSDAPMPAVRQRFLAAAATGVGALFTLVVASQWFAAWVLSPCLQ